jgi:hypothetical protein
VPSDSSNLLLFFSVESLLEVKRKNLLAEFDKLTGLGEPNEQLPTTSTNVDEFNEQDRINELDMSGIVGNKNICL